MPRHKPCPECASTELLVHEDVAARGAYGPDLLPGGSKWYGVPRMTAVVCRGCGYIRNFASGDTRDRLSTDRRWRRTR